MGLSIGLIGVGIWGQKILSELVSQRVEVAVQDMDNVALNQALSMGAKFAETDLDTFLKRNFDGIVIASATASHETILAKIDSYGLPTFVEKPIVNSNEGLMIIKTLSNPLIFPMHIWKYHPGITLLGEIVREERIGKLKGVKSMRTNWTSPRQDTNTLWNLAIHDLSICETIMGFIPSKKYVSAEKHEGVIRGATVLMGDSPYYNFEVSNRYPTKNRSVQVFGTDGVALLLDEKVDYVEFFKGDHYSDLDKDPLRLTFDKTPPLRLELTAFLDYLRGGDPPRSDLSEALRLTHELLQIEGMIS